MLNLLKTSYRSKITEIQSKIPSIGGFVAKSTLTAVENKILDNNSLVKKEKKKTKQIIYRKYVKLNKRLLIIIMVNILILPNLII